MAKKVVVYILNKTNLHEHTCGHAFVSKCYWLTFRRSECCMFIPGTYAEMMQDYG